jgi:hypothetical protein
MNLNVNCITFYEVENVVLPFLAIKEMKNVLTEFPVSPATQ